MWPDKIRFWLAIPCLMNYSLHLLLPMAARDDFGRFRNALKEAMQCMKPHPSFLRRYYASVFIRDMNLQSLRTI